MNPYEPLHSEKPKYKPRSVDWPDFFFVVFFLISFPLLYGFILESELTEDILIAIRKLFR